MEYNRALVPDGQTVNSPREQAGGPSEAADVGKNFFSIHESRLGKPRRLSSFQRQKNERRIESMGHGPYKRSLDTWARPHMEWELAVNQSPLAKLGSIPTSPTMRL